MDYVCTCLDGSMLIERYHGNEDKSCPIIIAKFYNTLRPDLLLIGHIDVAPGEEQQFLPVEKDGRIYGRGAKDMKAGVAAMIGIMNFYASSSLKPNLAIAVVSDEENGGYFGTNLIVNKLGYNPQFVISPDPGEDHCIINKEKGFIWASLKVRGKSCHPSRPWLGECAYRNSLEVIAELKKKFNLAINENDWRTTLCLTRMEKIFEDGSPDHSPAAAGFVKSRIDIRYTENELPEEIIDEANITVKKYNPENDLEILNTASVCFTPEDNTNLINFRKAAELTEGKSISLKASCGASDLRFFSQKKIPCVNFGPDGKNHHSIDEYVVTESMNDFYHSIIRYIDDNLI